MIILRMKYLLLLLFIFLVDASFLSKLAETYKDEFLHKNLPQENKKRSQLCTSNLAIKTSAPNIPVNGNVYRQELTAAGCYPVSFNIPSTFTSDILISGSSTGFFFTFGIINNNAWTSTSFNDDVFFSSSSFNVSFANCQLIQDPLWFVVAQYSGNGGDNFTISVTSMPAATIKTDQSTTSIVGQVTPPAIYDLALLTIPNPAVSNIITINSTSTFPYLYLNRNTCPTSNINDYASQGVIELSPFVTTQANQKIYFAAEYNSEISYDVALNIQPVQCGIIPSSDFAVCKVPYPTLLLSKAQVSNVESLIELILVLESSQLSAQCIPILTQVICGGIFSKCDPNNFPLPPCPTDCKALAANCPNFNSTVCQGVPAANTFCYLSTSSSSNQMKTNLILILVCVIMMLFAY